MHYRASHKTCLKGTHISEALRCWLWIHFRNSFQFNRLPFFLIHIVLADWWCINHSTKDIVIPSMGPIYDTMTCHDLSTITIAKAKCLLFHHLLMQQPTTLPRLPDVSEIDKCHNQFQFPNIKTPNRVTESSNPNPNYLKILRYEIAE